MKKIPPPPKFILSSILVLLLFFGCKKVDLENPEIRSYENEFSQLAVFQNKKVPSGTLKQLKMRYGNADNWLRFTNSFKPRHYYDSIRQSESSIELMSLPVYPTVQIEIYDQDNFLLGRERIRKDLYILDQLEEKGYDLPYSGRAGTDPTCAVRLLSGIVDQHDQTFLSDHQIHAGFVLISVAYAESDIAIKIHQEEYLYTTNWNEWDDYDYTYTGGTGGTGGTNNNNLTTSTYKGVIYTPNDFPGKEANMPWMWWVNANINSQFYDAWEMMEEERLEDEYSANIDCYGTGRVGNAYFPGTVEHWLIQVDYVSRFMGGIREYSIPFAGPSENRRGYVDLANIMTREMFEIKPDNNNGQIAGMAEISNYVTLANAHCPVVPPWRKGTYYPSHTLRAGNRALTCRLHDPGVIVYSWNSNAPRVIPVASEEVLKKLRELLKLMQFAGENYNLILTTFLQYNPDVVIYLKSAMIGAAAAVVVGTIIEDIATLGAGIADDWLHFMMAYRLYRFALAL